MFADSRRVVAAGQSRHLTPMLGGSLLLGLVAGGASVGLLALSGWFIAMSALAGAGLATGFSFLYPSAGVQALAFGRTVIRYLERLSGHSATLRIDAGLKESVFASAVGPAHRISAAGPGVEDHTGVLLHAIDSDAEVAESALLRILGPIVTYAGVLVGGCCLIAATVSARLAAVTLVGGLVVAGVVILPGWASSLRPGRRLAEGEARARDEIVDALDGLDELASFGAEAMALQRVETALSGVEQAQKRLRGIEVATRALALAAVGATVLLVAGLSSGDIGGHRSAVASAATVTLAALGILQLSDPLAAAAREIGRTSSVWHRLARLLPETAPTPGVTGSATDRSIPGTVEVRDLTIDRGRGTIVGDLTLTASPGQTILLNGPSGAGKTTVILALAHQLDTVLGADASARVQVGGRVMSLPQHPYAFRGTVADNLRIAGPRATEEEMEEALILVGLYDVLGESPLSQRIGAGGRALSGGQLRRLSIAQILLGRPDVLLADEPTEGLDAASARELLLALRLANPSMTMVLALHEQQAGQLSWAPDTLVRLRLDRPTAAVSGSTTVAGPHGADGRGERS